MSIRNLGVSAQQEPSLRICYALFITSFGRTHRMCPGCGNGLMNQEAHTCWTQKENSVDYPS